MPESRRRWRRSKGQPLAPFCGIGNPAGFRHTLAECGYQFSQLREFPDHHAYSAADGASLVAWARATAPQALVCTHKDLVKLAAFDFASLPVWAIEIDLKITVGEELLLERLAEVAGAAAS